MKSIEVTDYASPEGVEQLKRLFEPEYRTLASIKDNLLEHAPGQWFAIQGERCEVRASLDDAERAGHTIFERRLFLLGRIERTEIEGYLSVLD